MQTSAMVLAAAFLLFAIVDVNGEAHAACEAVGKEMEESPPKTTDGKVCFGSRRLSALISSRSLLSSRSPFHERRLDKHDGMQEMMMMCDPNCKAGLQKYIDACKPIIEDAGEKAEMENIEMMMTSMCNPCGMGFMQMVGMGDECDTGKCPPEDGETCKICEVSDACKSIVCQMVSSCDASKPLMGVSEKDWKEGVNGFTDGVASCPCADPEGSTSSAKLRAASSGLMLLLVSLVFVQQ
eukprot:gnl/TRDRNA2_/TRDRNA2_165293_c0_seq1.p1 gnl/TRDRNA2_/TRDRNA2_165293_c0~~gnl/TRDRNA2_/TRDRNA2_165293_c0_seq1.p1  ORF type:complete len:239 (-),score=56.95 gnl/TRDRNA2_/TRDRNA2_165293_c0_seq1:142-858(-)